MLDAAPLAKKDILVICDVAAGIDGRRACFEELIYENAVLNLKTRSTRELRYGQNSDSGNYQISFQLHAGGERQGSFVYTFDLRPPHEMYATIRVIFFEKLRHLRGEEALPHPVLRKHHGGMRALLRAL